VKFYSTPSLLSLTNHEFPLVVYHIFENWHFRCSHRFSIGFRSGDWAGHSSIWILLFPNHCCVFLRCVSGHCLTEKSSISNVSKLSITPSSNISQYWSAFIFPSTSTSFPTPFHPIQPHTIRLFPPSCLTVGVVVWSDIAPPFFSRYTPFHLTQSC